MIILGFICKFQIKTISIKYYSFKLFVNEILSIENAMSGPIIHLLLRNQRVFQ